MSEATPSSPEALPEDGSGCFPLIIGSVFVAPVLALVLIWIIEALGLPLDLDAEAMVFMTTLSIVAGVAMGKAYTWPRRLALATLATLLFVGLFIGYPNRPQWVREVEEFLMLIPF